MKGHPLEKLIRDWLKVLGYQVHLAEASRKTYQEGGQTKHRTLAHDILGCIDLVAVQVRPSKADIPAELGQLPELWWIQATTQAGRSKRRRKLEAVAWPERALRLGVLRVSLFSHVATNHPADFRRSIHHFRAQHRVPGLGGTLVWTPSVALPIKLRKETR